MIFVKDHGTAEHIALKAHLSMLTHRLKDGVNVRDGNISIVGSGLYLSTVDHVHGIRGFEVQEVEQPGDRAIHFFGNYISRNDPVHLFALM